MTAPQIAELLAAKPTANGWSACCPAHDDRRPSLAITEGRDGRTLLYCWTGCPLESIVAAIGLSTSDLFEKRMELRAFGGQGPYGRPNVVDADKIELAVRREFEQIIERESDRVGFVVAPLARHRNAAREVVNRRFDLSARNAELSWERVPWFEVEPHAVDPAWSACVDAALHVVAARAGVSGDQLAAFIETLPRTQHLVLRIARRFQRSLAIGRSTATRAA